MDPSYSAPQSFSLYEQSQWTGESKPQFVNGQPEFTTNASSLDLADSTGSSSSTSRRTSNLTPEEDAHLGEEMWPTKVSESHSHMRHPSQSHSMNGHASHMLRLQDPNVSMVGHYPQWPSSQSGSNTPTPLYGSVETFNQMPFGQMPQNLPYHHEVNSAIPMSPESSQGGWASAASSDGIEQRGMIQSPVYRPTSPSLVVRSDGIRKKNARFEIPKDRNLSNIDAMIQQTTDENEKKELKQQKRLLRNRQAALDSRQRKKTHTEKLEQEKKISEKKMFDLEEALSRSENTLNIEREQWMQQFQQMEQMIHALQCERDDAIRTNTLETADLRRKNNMLQECISDLERQQPHKQYVPTLNSDGFNNQIDDYDLPENLNPDFTFITEDDYMDDNDHSQRQVTPKPPIHRNSEVIKAEGFSWSTFYMCLVFGAFLAANGKASDSTNTTSDIASFIPSSEAGNVLKAVLKNSNTDALSSHVTDITAKESTPVSTSQSNARVMPGSSLDNLHQTLSTPSRQQELQAAFSLSAASYNHITDPYNEHLNPRPSHELANEPHKPSPIQQAFAEMKTQRDEMERVNGIGSKLRERSVLWDHVPSQVVKDFNELIKRNSGVSADIDVKMEH